MDKDLNKKQNQKVTIFAIILSMISIGLLVAGFFLVSSDKVVMLQSISNLTSKLENAFEDNSLIDKMATSKDIGVKVNMGLTSDYANGNLVIDYLENKDDKKSKLAFNFSIDNEELLGAHGVFANDNVYFYVDDITPKYYYTALEYVKVFSSLNVNDYDKIFSLLKESVTDYIDNDEIKKEKVEILYNGKNKKVNKLSYAVTNEAMVSMITNFINSLKGDKELLNSISNLVGKSSDEVKEELDNFVKELKYDEVKTGFYYNVYYYGFNKIVRYEFANASNKPVIEYKVEDKEIINFYDNDTIVFGLEVMKAKTQYEFKGLIKNTEDGTEISFTGTLKDDTLTVVIMQDGVSIKLAVTSTEDIKENNYVYKNKFVLSAESEGTEITLGSLDVDFEYYFNQKVNVDLSNSVDVSLISEEDTLIIESNLMNHPIYQLLSGLLGNMDVSL